MKLPEGETKINVNTGIPQGSPLSPILYLFYNADLVEIGQNTGALITGFVDDINIATTSPSISGNVDTLSNLLAEAQDWAHRHASVFAPEKFKLIHFR